MDSPDDRTIDGLMGARDSVSVMAPAGHGKTFAIACAVAGGTGRRLILTHTHAAIRALAATLQQRGIASSRYCLETISAFALRIARSYVSGAQQYQDAGAWEPLNEGVATVLGTRVLRGVIRQSYDGVYVDEYQDCTPAQHRIVLSLKEAVPCRVLGDPLQAIFAFTGHAPLRWKTDIFPYFRNLPDLDTAWRWRETPELARWIRIARHALMRGKPLDLRKQPGGFRKATPQEQRAACYAIGGDGTSVVAIFDLANRCNWYARTLRGFSSMDEVACKDLMKWVRVFATAEGLTLAQQVLRFASECRTEFGNSVQARILANAVHSRSKGTRSTRAAISETVSSLLRANDPEAIGAVLRAVDLCAGGRVFRRTLWHDMRRSLNLAAQRGGLSHLIAAAVTIRERIRRAGMRKDPRVVSRAVLVKGLEYDHAIVLDAKHHDARTFYVSITRGSKSSLAMADEPIVRFDPPFSQ